MIREPIKVWITRYALTRGIFTQDVIQMSIPTLVRNQTTSYHIPAPIYYNKPDWHSTEHEARADWERRITKAIAAAERKIKKLKAIDPWTAEIDNKGD